MQSVQSHPPRPATPLVFLSGGSALNETAALLAGRVPTTHIITTFDSGGSTQALRKALPIPAVGDIRSRILALADVRMPDIAALSALLHCRLSSSGMNAAGQEAAQGSPSASLSTDAIQNQFAAMARGTHPLLQGARPDHVREVVKSLNHFAILAPHDFDWEGASIGNLVLAAEYFARGQSLKAAVEHWAGILHCRGRVLPVSKTPLAHLAVRLRNGQTMVGQHKFTGKWQAHITSPIESLWLTKDRGRPYPITAQAGDNVEESLKNAGTIVYPVGSFFSSVACNLLVPGVGRAIASAVCPRVFVPNPGQDPELCGITLREQIDFLLKLLWQDTPEAPISSLLNTLVVDRARGQYPGGIPESYCRNLGVAIVDKSLLAQTKADIPEPLRVDGRKLAQTLEEVWAGG